MAAITTTGSGNFSSTTPDAPWPSGTVPTSSDTWTIASGHTVTLNGVFPATGTYAGDCTVTGTLEISTSANTGLNMGNANITGTGTVVTGTLSTPAAVGASYTCVFDFATSSDTKGLGGDGLTLKLSGSSICGSTIRSSVVSDVTAGQDITVDGDVTAWQIGQWVGIHSGTGYSSYTTDVQLVKIDTVGSLSGGDTPINVSANITTKAGATIFNLSRNIIVKRNSPTLTSNSFNTSNRPILNLGSKQETILEYVDFQGIYSVVGEDATLNYVVIRNGYADFTAGGNAENNKFNYFIYCMNQRYFNTKAAQVNNSFICSCSGKSNVIDNGGNIFVNTELFALNTFYPSDKFYECCIYANAAIRPINSSFKDCKFDINPNGTECASTSTFDNYTGNIAKFNNCSWKSTSVPIIGYGRYEIDFTNAASGNKVVDTDGTAERFTPVGSPSARTGGNDEIIKITPASTCTSFRIFTPWRTKIWLAADTYTIDIYIYANFDTNRNVSPAVDIKAFCRYLDSGTYFTSSEETDVSELTKNEWDNLQLGFTTGRDGFIEIWVEVYTYTSGKYYYIDPMIEIA